VLDKFRTLDWILIKKELEEILSFMQKESHPVAEAA
jgi:hypothetical protein